MNKIFKSIWDEFVYGGHLLSLGAVSIVFAAAILLNIAITWDFLLVVYLIVYTIYLYNRFIELEEDIITNYKRTRHLAKYIKHSPFIILCCSVIIIWILLYFGNWTSLIFGLILLLCGFLYSTFFKKITQKIVGFKNLYVAFFWALLIVFLVFYYSFEFNSPVFLLFIFVFLRWLVNAIFFDIKDVESDKKNNLKTIPVLLGKKRTLDYLLIINIFSFSPIILGILNNVFPIFALSFLSFFFYSFYYFEKIRNKNENVNKLSYIMVDGEYLLWPVVLFIGKLIIYD